LRRYGGKVFCSKKCLGQSMKKLVKTKRTYRFYNKAWKKISRSVKKRDGYTCQICHKQLESRGLDVHHIISLQEFGSAKQSHFQENLITLCKCCHGSLEKGTISLPDEIMIRAHAEYTNRFQEGPIGISA
jgi:predicted restriction endonuclease